MESSYMMFVENGGTLNNIAALSNWWLQEKLGEKGWGQGGLKRRTETIFGDW